VFVTVRSSVFELPTGFFHQSLLGGSIDPKKKERFAEPVEACGAEAERAPRLLRDGARHSRHAVTERTRRLSP
jgi:hypothetical protein